MAETKISPSHQKENSSADPATCSRSQNSSEAEPGLESMSVHQNPVLSTCSVAWPPKANGTMGDGAGGGWFDPQF